MPSPELLDNLQSDDANDPVIYLMTIEHPDLAEPYYWARDKRPVTSNSIEYLAFPFEFARPGEGESGTRSARIRIDNIDREIGNLVRALATPPWLTIFTVLRSDPDTVQEVFPPFELRAVQGNLYALEGDLTDVDDDGEAVMKWIMSPALAPALVS